MPRRHPAVLGALLAVPLGGLVLPAPPARGQSAPPRDTRLFEMRVPFPAPRYGKGPLAPLPPAIQEQVERGRALREAGRLGAARDTLTAALARVPHHPMVLAELASVHQERRAWRALEQLARAERAAARDSLLLAQDLVTALERQGRAREAAQTVVEAWVAAPVQSEWARVTLDSLILGDPKAIRELMRRTASAFPLRPDLARGAARIEWRLGDVASALRLLHAADDVSKGAPLRWAFAEELLASGAPHDSAGAVEVLLDLAADRDRESAYRLVAAQRVWEVYGRRTPGMREGAPRLARALKDLPAGRWGNALLIAVMRGLREAGLTAEARALLEPLGALAASIPEIALERALNDLRDGPPERALEPLRALAAGSPEGGFRYAEALFFSGQADSALAWYGSASRDPASPYTGAALERIYLIEDAEPRAALVLFGRLAFEQWRGESRKALGLADSLYRTLERGSLWAQSALALASLRETTGDGKAALEPLLAVAERAPDDRLAPLARQRAGDVLRLWHQDEARALQQYEECLARYPKAWNAPEVRRWVETLRRERHF